MNDNDPDQFQHYRVLRRPGDGKLWELGRGAMGVTYKAIDTRLHVNVCLKIIHERLLLEEQARERFLREARAAASLRHRNVASVFHLGEYGNNYFYVMEFVEGETLEALVERTGPLSVIDSLAIVLQVSRALMSGHSKKLVHRDIKPSNIMLADEVDESAVVKLIDFGLAKSVVDASASLSDVNSSGFLGTPRYASPEQCDERPLDIRSDIYSLGATLWFLLTAQPPFTGSIGQVFAQHLGKPPPLEKLPAHIPDSVRTLLGRMLAKNPADRQATPLILRREIEVCLREAPASGLVVPLSTLEIHPAADGSDSASTGTSEDSGSTPPEVDAANHSLATFVRRPAESPLAEAFADEQAAAAEPAEVLPELAESGVDLAVAFAASAEESAEEPAPAEQTAILREVPVPVAKIDAVLPARPEKTSTPVQTSSTDGSANARLGNRYRLHRLLREDEIGRLFLAESTADKREWVTARIFHSEIVESSPEAVPELQTAYERLHASPHPNVLELQSLDIAEKPGFLISAASARDFSLSDILRQRGSLGTSETIHLARTAAAGLEHLCAHSTGALDLSSRSLFVRLHEGASSASYPDPADNRLLSEPVERWQDFSLKLDPLPTILPARWREAGTSSTWGGTRVLSRSRVAAATARRDPARAMALLCYEMLAGALPTELAGQMDRRGPFPPLPRLSASANELLQRALADQCASVSATEFCEEFAAVHAAAPSVVVPETPVSPAGIDRELAADLGETAFIDRPAISALVPGFAEQEAAAAAPSPGDEPALAEPVSEAAAAPILQAAPVPTLKFVPNRPAPPVALTGTRAWRSPLVLAAAGTVILVAIVSIVFGMTRTRTNQTTAAAVDHPGTTRLADSPVAAGVVPSPPPAPVVATNVATSPALSVAVQTPAPAPSVTPPVAAQQASAPTPDAITTAATGTPVPTVASSKLWQTASDAALPSPNRLQAPPDAPTPRASRDTAARDSGSRDSAPRTARQTQQDAPRTHPRSDSPATTQRQKASEPPPTTQKAPAPASTTTTTTTRKSSESSTRNVDVFKGGAPGG